MPKRLLTSLTLFIVSIVVLLSPGTVAAATNYYVSPSGNNQGGTNWTNAWKEMDQINWSVIQPGDTIYLDGGTTSITYRTRLTPTKSGTATSPITIKLSSEAGRNGKVIIHGGRQAQLPECGQKSYSPYSSAAGVSQLDQAIQLYGVSYITIDGTKWGGIELTRSGNGIRYDENSTNTIIRNMEIHDNGRIEQKSDGSVSNLWYSDGPGIRIEGRNHTFERLNVHDNGQDNIQSGGGLVKLGNITVRDSWLHNQRIHSGTDNGPSGDSPDELGAPQNGPSYNGFKESFNWCRHSDAIQVFNGDGGAVSGLKFENSIFGPGHTNTLILGDTSGGGATITNLTMKNVLIIKGADNNINGKDGPSSHDNWNMQNITVYSPNTKSNGVRIFGGNHHISNSVFYQANAYFENKLSTDTGNCVYDMSGHDFGSVFTKPVFTKATTDPFALDDYTIPAGTACAGKGSSLTSVDQLLALVGSTTVPNPTPTPSPTVMPTATPTPAPETCAEDINIDHQVNLLDYSILVEDFSSLTPTNPRSNIDGKGGVDLLDYSMLVNRFFESC